MTTNSSVRRKPTQGDVARLAQVSQATVSYVLNNSTAVNVPLETRQRILNAAAELGYVPNSAARTLRTRKTMTLAAIIPDITNPFYPWFERGIQDVAEAHNYDLITYNTDGEQAKERKALESARQGRVDGMVLTTFHLTPSDFLPLVQSGVAITVLGQPGNGWELVGIDTLSSPNALAARTAVEHLLDRGHTRIAMIAGIEGTPPREHRVQGYREALAAHSVKAEEQLLRAGPYTEQGGYEATQELIRLNPRPTAIFAANDLMAIGAMQALREAGLRIPDDIALVGFDDIPAASLVHPALTTVAQFPLPLGRRAAELLIERLEGKAPAEGRHLDMPFELLVRESA